MAMGEGKEGAKPETGKKPAADATKDNGKVTAVYMIDIHCEGCAKKIKRAIKHYEGVEDVKADSNANKLTVIGKIDPARVGDRLAEKTKKKVRLISPPPKKDAAPAAGATGGGDKKSEAYKNPEEKKEEKKPPKESTAVLKIRTHCDGCIHKMRKIILKVDGVQSVMVDGVKDLVTVKGTMDLKELVPYLKEKLKRNVDVTSSKKDDAGEKKDGEGKKVKEVTIAADGGEKKKGGDGDGGEAKVEVKKMEYHGYGYPSQQMYWPGGDAYRSGYTIEEYHNHHHHVYGANQGYMNMMDPRNLHAPQMFSDENPNACSVM